MAACTMPYADFRAFLTALRAAIEDDPKKPRRILTVRGAGYVFARDQDR